MTDEEDQIHRKSDCKGPQRGWRW